MSTPRLLVVELAAVITELENLREDWINTKAAEIGRMRGGRLVYDDIRDKAEHAWADAFPALELLRDEIR